MTTVLTILLAALALYALFKIGEVVMKILLGLVVVALIAYLVTNYIGLNVWELF